MSAARAFVTGVLSEFAESGPHPLAPAARLVVSELASNAVQHARTPFDVDVSCNGEIVISVTDASPAPPQPRQPAPDALAGRGLYVVEQTCDEWGFTPTDRGKSVWGRLGSGPPQLDVH